ncbi:uncharacterized protein LOC124154457 isoform X2 [Ischnura elegans]|uniref:uncharacterized protein LOC124154457 isoform X2 n=1 Tax=Ischnura elegans TaxID=197161 RepID=UPI001ED89C05|nr:uncharacterized protein LOC124154457 isoform X2 [Ischnura elegans]
MISLCIKRCLLRQLPISSPKCNRILPAMFGASLGFSVKAATESLEEPKLVQSMSDKALIQNASSVTAASVNQLLVLSGAILVKHHENYRKAIENILLLMDRITLFKDSEVIQEELWTEMVSARAKLEGSKKDLFEMQGFVEYIEKLVTATVEVSYLADSELSSTTLCEALNSVLEKIQFQQTKTKDLEAEYQAQQQDFIVTIGKKETPPKSEENGD